MKIVNSLWPNDAIWRHRSGSTLVHVMACCLAAPSHYLNKCWLLINEVLCHSPKSNYTASSHATNILYNECGTHNFKMTATSLRSQWVNGGTCCAIQLNDRFNQPYCVVAVRTQAHKITRKARGRRPPTSQEISSFNFTMCACYKNFTLYFSLRVRVCKDMLDIEE